MQVDAGKTRCALGIDAGGTKIAAGLVDQDGNILDSERVATPRFGSGEAAEALRTVAGAVLDRNPTASVVGIGAGLPGLVDAHTGRFAYGPNFPLKDVEIASVLEDRFSLPITIDNDANLAAWAEYIHGAGERCVDMVMITIGTGIGGGIVVADRLLRGAHGFAGEVGHITTDLTGGVLCTCGKRGCWEASASGRGLDELASKLMDSPIGAAIAAVGDDHMSPGQRVAEAAKMGDGAALAAMDAFADLVAAGLQSLVQIFDPARIVVGGGVSDDHEVLFGPLRHHFRQRFSGGDHRPDVPILPASLGGKAGIVGGASIVLHPSS